MLGIRTAATLRSHTQRGALLSLVVVEISVAHPLCEVVLSLIHDNPPRGIAHIRMVLSGDLYTANQALLVDILRALAETLLNARVAMRSLVPHWFGTSTRLAITLEIEIARVTIRVECFRAGRRVERLIALLSLINYLLH